MATRSWICSTPCTCAAPELDLMDEPPGRRMSEQHQIVSASEEHAAEAPRGTALGLSRRARRAPRPPPRAQVPHGHRGARRPGHWRDRGGHRPCSRQRHAVTAAPWSPGRRPIQRTAGAQDIADHIAPLYRISPVDQLSVVTVVGLANSGSASAASSGATGSSTSPSRPQVAVRPSPSSSALALDRQDGRLQPLRHRRRELRDRRRLAVLGPPAAAPPRGAGARPLHVQVRRRREQRRRDPARPAGRAPPEHRARSAPSPRWPNRRPSRSTWPCCSSTTSSSPGSTVHSPRPCQRISRPPWPRCAARPRPGSWSR